MNAGVEITLLNASVSAPAVDPNVPPPTMAEFGGAIALMNPQEGGQQTRILDCSIEENFARTMGGGIYIGCEAGPCGDGVVDIEGCTIHMNGRLIDPMGAEQITDSGGGIAANSSGPEIIRNFILSNECDGGAVGGGGGGGVFCLGATAGTRIDNNIIARNSTTDDPGGGIFYAGAGITMTSNTVAKNTTIDTSGFNGSGIFINAVGVSLVNHIVWGNDPSSVWSQLFGMPTVSFSDVGGPTAGWIDLTNNISLVPQFVAVAVDDFHIKASSPCVNVGDNSAPGLTLLDIDGANRIITNVVDMGADETGHLPIGGQ